MIRKLAFALRAIAMGVFMALLKKSQDQNEQAYSSRSLRSDHIVLSGSFGTIAVEGLSEEDDQLQIIEELQSIIEGLAGITNPIAKSAVERSLKEVKTRSDVSDLLEMVYLLNPPKGSREAEESLRQGWKEVMSGQTIPLSQFWEGIDDE